MREPCSDPSVNIFKLTGDIFLNRMDARIVELGPDAEPLSTGPSGTDRLLYCIQCEVKVVVDAKTYLLRAGDMLYLLPEAAEMLDKTSVAPTTTRILTVNAKA